MSKTNTNQKPFDVVMNEHFVQYQSKGFSRNWFIPIVKEQSEMDYLINEKKDGRYSNYGLQRRYPNTLLEVNKDEEGNPTSIYVLYSKGGKLYRVVSQKDYGVIKSRMELKNGKYVPYEKCDLEPYNGVVELWDNDTKISSVSYKNGVKDGECFNYYKGGTPIRNKETNEWRTIQYFEKTTYKNGKKNGEYENTKKKIKGSYIDNKKNGVWYQDEETIKKQIFESYKKKFDLNDYEVKKFVRKQFSEFLYSNNPIKVFYVNDVLNGEFQTNRYKGEIQLGLPNGLFSNDIDLDWGDTIRKTLFDNGLRVSEIELEFEDEWDDRDEKTITITNYEDGMISNLIQLSSQINQEIPKEFSSLTEEYLTEDVFYSIIKMDMNVFRETLEGFLSSWVVISKSDWVLETTQWNEYNNYKTDWIDISQTKLDYEIRDLDKHLMDECGYPYFEEYDSGRKRIKTSREYDDYDLESSLTKVFSVSKKGEPTKVFLNGVVVDEEIDGEINPIILDYQKQEIQSLVERMKSSYEIELKRKEMEKQREEEQKQKEREENGLSLSSFPMD